MKKLHIFGMMVLATAGLCSCEADKDPVLNEPTEFVLNTPPFANQLYQLSEGGVLELTCSQPNYGITAATDYVVEVSLLENFGADLPAPGEDEAPYLVPLTPIDAGSAVLRLRESELSTAILSMRGITANDEDSYVSAIQPVYVRAIASIAGQAVTRIVSNGGVPVVLAQVQDYFSYETKAKVLYTPGASNGWNQGASQQLLENAKKKGEFLGMIYLTGEFKFTNQPDWAGINYGNKKVAEDGLSGELSVDGGAGNLPLPSAGAGLYYATVKTKDLTYTLVPVTAIGVCGSALPTQWDETKAPDMTPSADFLTWTYTGIFADGEFKFVINNSWDKPGNYGTDADSDVDGALKLDGGNIAISAGEHTVTISFATLPYTVTIE